jgi:hypothetical protein
VAKKTQTQLSIVAAAQANDKTEFAVGRFPFAGTADLR